MGVTGLERPGDAPKLLHNENVFVGTIDSLDDENAWIRVSEVLHGTVTRRQQHVALTQRRILEAPGTRVLVVTGPMYAGYLWARLFLIKPDGQLAGVRSTGTLSGYPNDSYFPRREVPRLSELRVLDTQYRGRSGSAPFAAAASLHLVLVEASRHDGADRIALRLRVLGTLFGQPTRRDSIVQFTVPADGGGNVIPVVGDSLVLPWAAATPRLGFTSRPGDFLVDRGFVSSLDVALEDLEGQVHRLADGYVIAAAASSPTD